MGQRRRHPCRGLASSPLALSLLLLALSLHAAVSAPRKPRRLHRLWSKSRRSPPSSDNPSLSSPPSPPQSPRQSHDAPKNASAASSTSSCFTLVNTDEMGHETIPSFQKYPLCSLPDKWRGRYKVTVYSTSLGVKWKGWGTTLGDTASYIGDLERPEASCMGDLLFHKDYLGLNMVRYQIPGGYHPRFSPRMAANPRNSRGFWPKWDNMSFFNPGADTAQVRLLRLALMKGVQYLEAISYSPPYWMTKTKMVEGAAKKYESNLRPAYGSKYARYLRTVVDFLESEYKFQFYSIAPFNEPLEGWWTNEPVKKSAHEGCNFNVTEVNTQMDEVRSWFGWNRRISGVDSWVRSMSTVLPKPWEGVDDGSLRWRKFNQLDVHGYRLKDTTTPADDYCSLCGMNTQARRLNMSVWQSEWGPLGISKATDLELALFMARKIIQHINLLGVEAWFHWQVIAQVNYFWGIVRLHFFDDPNKVYLTKSYHAFRHFSKFMTKGSIPLYVSQRCDHTVVAISRPVIQAVIVSFVNQRGKSRTFSLSLRGFVCGKGCSARGFVTDEKRNFEPFVLRSLREVFVPEFSFVTVVIEGVKGRPNHKAGRPSPFCSAAWMKRFKCPLAPR